MKAYMSVGQYRHDGRHSDSVWEALGAGPGTFVGMIYARDAVAEAERILAVTEPVSCQSDYYRAVGLWPSSLQRPTMERSQLAERVLANMAASAGTFALIGEERLALADALRAFVVSR